MEQAKVFFTDFRCHPGVNQQQKLEKLLLAAGMDTIDFEGKIVAIKLHFGEVGNLAYLRPNYAKTVADFVKARGGRPFLTDCNTLYIGSRKNALEHMDAAYLNGFSPFSTGCHVIIADGLRGGDDVEVPVVGGEYVKYAKIGRALMDADIVISLTHFKGHEQAGYGGALKNLGMGGGSRAGKMEMHAKGKPHVITSKCVGCGRCAKICAHGAPIITDKKCAIDHDKCLGCGRCIAICPKDAIAPDCDEIAEVLNYKIAEYAKAVVDGRPSFHISIVRDISPDCDCHPENDVPMVPDVGMFASFDPVALDLACAEAVNRQPVLPGSRLAETADPEDHDHLHAMHPNTCWRAAQESIAYQSYDLVDAMEKDAGVTLSQLRVDGGASRDGFLMQFQADVLGKPVRRPVIRETTALGAAYLAGLAVGVWKDREELQSLWHCDVTFAPQMEQEKKEKLLRGWHKAVGRSLDWEEH